MTMDADANKLNRELLRWIQSLDLAYSIKNVKRDFSNGFLVAEIMSRYYDKDISMHSYDNGIGVKVKKDNWDQLGRIFGKFSDLEPLVPRADIDAIIHCQNGAAVGFLTKLYQCLTKRTIQPTVASSSMTGASHQHGSAPIAKSIENIESIPPYAKPTGSALIREKMRDADIAESSDETQINRKVRTIHSQHEETLQLDRLLTDTPDRYAPSLRSPGKNAVLRGATKPVRNDDSSPALFVQHVVKEVQIKAMDGKSLEKLRATRELKDHDFANGSNASFDTHGGHSGLGSRGSHNSSSSTTDLIQRRKPLDLLSEAVECALATTGSTSKLEQRGKDKFESFVDAVVASDHFTDAESVDVLLQLVDDAGLVAASLLDFPREFWKVVGLLYPLLSEHSDEHVLFHAAHQMFVTLGRQCVRRDSTTAALLMSETLLPKVVRDLRRSSLKRAPLLQIVYAFVADSALAHIQTIKRLREALPNDIPLFIHALSILLFAETDLSDAALVDLYHYYCCIGLETSCEKLRAACLSMLVPLLTSDAALVVDLLPRLTQFATRHAWWEVKAQLVIVASCFLHTATALLAMHESNEVDWTDQIELALTIIEREFHPTASLNIRRIGLAYLAKNLAGYQELVPLYVDVLFSLPPAVRSVMLRTVESPERQHQNHQQALDSDAHSFDYRNALPIRGASGAQYQLMQLPAHWDSVAVAKQIYYEWKSQDHASADVVQVLQSCFAQLHASDQSQQAAMLYDQMRDFVVLGLLDAGGCTSVAEILIELVAASRVSVDDVFQHSVLVDCLQKLVTHNVDDIRQQAAVRMLRDASGVDAKSAASVRRCVQTLRSMCDASTFNASLFAVALDAGG